ncbi:MAG: site-specific integrase [Deltaproteobacteria bacterium]|nr:site-specific integrase [Deltaproteobacteria bacterium]
MSNIIARLTNKTVKFCFKLFFDEYINIHLKKQTARSYFSFWKNHIRPHIGDKIINQVVLSDIEGLHLKLKSTPTTANRVLSLLSKFFSWCKKKGFVSDHLSLPSNLVRYQENRVLRFLSQKQMRDIWEAIARLENLGKLNPIPAAALKLLILTGARKNEILALRWSDLDLDNSRITLKESKTGFKTIYLSQQAIDIINSLNKSGDFIFPSKSASGHLFDLQWQWNSVLKEANLPGRWRIHDLRHGFASTAVNSGGSLSFIGFLLGHKRASTTERYAHVAENPAQALLDKVCQIITSK